MPGAADMSCPGRVTFRHAVPRWRPVPRFGRPVPDGALREVSEARRALAECAAEPGIADLRPFAAVYVP